MWRTPAPADPGASGGGDGGGRDTLPATPLGEGTDGPRETGFADATAAAAGGRGDGSQAAAAIGRGGRAEGRPADEAGPATPSREGLIEAPCSASTTQAGMESPRVGSWEAAVAAKTRYDLLSTPGLPDGDRWEAEAEIRREVREEVREELWGEVRELLEGVKGLSHRDLDGIARQLGLEPR